MRQTSIEKIAVRGPNPLEVPGGQQIELKMHEYELEFGYSFGF